MRNWLVGIFCLASVSANAADREIFAEVYESVPRQYIAPVGVDELAVLALKGISEVSPRLKMGSDETRLTLYYNAKVVKSFLKPLDGNDAQAWADLSAKLVDLAVEKSPEALQREFEITDLMMMQAFPKLDADSRYYRGFLEDKHKRKKHVRNFSDRMIDDFLYIKIRAFNQYSKKNLIEALKKNEQAKGLILDLRSSPGGVLSEAIEIADVFLDEGIIVSTRGRMEDANVFYNAKEGEEFVGKPMVVLVDEQTASSAEVVSAALKEQGRAQIIGTKTHGKGTVQNLISLSDGATIALTSAYFYTPSGAKIHLEGVQPDVCTYEMSESKDVEKLLASSNDAFCRGETREDKGLEIEIAKAVLQKM